MKLGGIDKHCIHAKWKTDRRLSMVGGGGGEGAPIGYEKKALRGNFNLFHLCFTNEIRGGIDTLYIQNGRGWADRRLSMVGGGRGELLEKEKRNGEYRPISAVGDK